jgi:hypothetical protein
MVSLMCIDFILNAVEKGKNWGVSADQYFFARV